MSYTISKFFNFIGLVVFFQLLLLLYTVNGIKVDTQLLSDLQDSRYATRLTADMLRQSSDDLTRFARQYVSTGDEQYKTNYNKVLYIRNGELPLPENYQNIYWDLLEPLRTQNHPNTN
jgi:methyl-accepting chemotaxis protein